MNHIKQISWAVILFLISNPTWAQVDGANPTGAQKEGASKTINHINENKAEEPSEESSRSRALADDDSKSKSGSDLTPEERRIKAGFLLKDAVTDKDKLQAGLKKLTDKDIEALVKCLEKGAGVKGCGFASDIPQGTQAILEEFINSQKKDDDLFSDIDAAKKDPSPENLKKQEAAEKELNKRAEKFPGLNEIYNALKPKPTKVELYQKLTAIQKADPSKSEEWEKAHKIADHLITSMQGKNRTKLLSQLNAIASKSPENKAKLEHFKATLELSEHMKTGESPSSFRSEFLDKYPALKAAAIQSRKDETARAIRYHELEKLAATQPPTQESQAAAAELQAKYNHPQAQAWRLGNLDGDKTKTDAFIASTPKDNDGNLVLSSLIRPASLPPLPGQPNNPRPAGAGPGPVHIAIKSDAESVQKFGEILNDKYQNDLRPTGAVQESKDQRDLLEKELKANGGDLQSAINTLSKDKNIQNQFGTDEPGLKKLLTSASGSHFVGKYNPKTKQMEWVQTDLTQKYQSGLAAPSDKEDPKTDGKPDSGGTPASQPSNSAPPPDTGSAASTAPDPEEFAKFNEDQDALNKASEKADNDAREASDTFQEKEKDHAFRKRILANEEKALSDA